VFDVVQIDHLARGVHVAEWDANEAGGDAAPSDLDGAGVGAGGARVGFYLVGDFLGLGGVEEFGEDFGVDVGATAEDGAAAEFEFAKFAVVAVGVVGGVADVDCHGDVGRDGVAGGGGTAHADFFLHGANGDDFGVEGGGFAFGGEAYQGFAYGVGTDFVVEGACGGD